MTDGLLHSLGLDPSTFCDGKLAVYTPVDGSRLATVRPEGRATVAAKVERTEQTFRAWRQMPTPRRGEPVRLFGEELRRYKVGLGELVSREVDKITQEGLGEVQEMIDICDFAAGLSRQLYNPTIASERPGHHMRETWYPLGVVDVISTLNFPIAV